MTNSRIDELDLLRFAGVIAIVLFHYAFRGYAGDAMSVMPYPWLAPAAKYGYLALELLFMISGFVIAGSVTNRSLRDFALSRIVRLYPAFWACCTLTFAVTLAIGAPRYSVTVGQYLINLTMLAEFLRVPSVDGVYWFLYVQLLFYALVAGAVFVGGVNRFQWFLAAWLAGELALEILPIGPIPAHILADYSVCFIAGAVCFLMRSRGLTLARIGMLIAALALALLQAFNRLPGLERHYQTILSRYVVVGIIVGSFFVMMTIALRRGTGVSHPRWVLAGAISYPLFLLHENIGFMIFNALYPAFNAHLLLWVTIVMMIGASYVVHVMVERRFAAPMQAAISRRAA